MNMVVTHLCTQCNEYYEEWQMESIEEHLCSDCASSNEIGKVIDELNATIDSLRAELAALRAKPDAHFDDFMRRYSWDTAQGLDAPDAPGWYAFEGRMYWSSNKFKSLIFVTDIGGSKFSASIMMRDKDNHKIVSVEYHSPTVIVGKWYRLHLPWDTAPVEVQPVQAMDLANVIRARWGADWHKEGRDLIVYDEACNDVLALLDVIDALQGKRPAAEVQPVPVEALEYVVTHYLLSSTSAPLGDRKDYHQQMFKVQEWLGTLQQRTAAEAQP